MNKNIPVNKQTTEEVQEIMEIFPALHKYKEDHTEDNLRKLCVEVSEFCRAIYASTKSQKERDIYLSYIKKLIK